MAIQEVEVIELKPRENLYLGKYRLDQEGNPYVPPEYIHDRNFNGVFRPLDIMDQKMVIPKRVSLGVIQFKRRSKGSSR